jgi:hypothetical protein
MNELGWSDVTLDQEWVSGVWEDRTGVAHYRAESFSDKVVERVTFRQAVNPYHGDDSLSFAEWMEKTVDLVRFWLLQQDQVIDKTFDSEGAPLGYFSPVSRPLERRDGGVCAQLLMLGLCMDADQRLTVTGEEAFDAAVAAGEVTPVESEHAEHRIRQMTLASAVGEWPPAFVRNFALASDISASSSRQ